MASIKATTNLRVEDFCIRYLVVTPLWITMAERFLIEEFQPVWNVRIDGFGNHAPGKGRAAMEVPWWDAMHPGRGWAAKLKQTRTSQQATERIADFFKLIDTNPDAVRREAKLAAEAQVEEETEEA